MNRLFGSCLKWSTSPKFHRTHTNAFLEIRFRFAIDYGSSNFRRASKRHLTYFFINSAPLQEREGAVLQMFVEYQVQKTICECCFINWLRWLHAEPQNLPFHVDLISELRLSSIELLELVLRYTNCNCLFTLYMFSWLRLLWTSLSSNGAKVL